MSEPFLTSGFGDEAGSTIEEQIQAIKSARLGGIDIRSVDNVNVLDLTIYQLADVKQKCSDAGVRIQSVGSPVNKVSMAKETPKAEQDRLQKAIHAANNLGTRTVRIFTPEAPSESWGEIKELMQSMIVMAEASDILLLHENDGKYFAAYPENAKRLFEELGSPLFRAAFDFANTVIIGYKPLRDWFPWILPYIHTLHMKDARSGSGEVVACGDGDAEIVETLKFMIDKGWHGVLTLEPHLKASGPLGGYSGPEMFNYATSKMKDCLKAAGGEPEEVSY